MRGHVRQRGRGWELRVFVGSDPVTNRKKYVTRTVYGTKRDADNELAKLVVKLSGVGHSAQDATLADLIHRWFEMARGQLSPTTVRTYELYIDNLILPRLGHLRLSRLGPADLDHFYAEVHANGARDGGPLAPGTVRQVHAIIRRALRQGMKWGWIATNAASLASPPTVRRPNLNPPEPDDVVRLMTAADQKNPQLGCLLRVAATTGARRGELCALKWSKVDLTTGSVLIDHAVVEGEHGRPIEKDTKTHSARRIALDPGTVSALTEQLRRSRERAADFRVSLRSDAYVFSHAPDGSKPINPSELTKSFVSLRKVVGLPDVRFHDLRHFAATRLLGAGVPVRTVSGRLGHSNAATTLGVYAHFIEASDREAAVAIGALLDQQN